MLLHFPDEALSALVASRVALESVLGEKSISVMLCVSLLMQVRRFADLAGFPCLQVLPLSGRDEDMLVEVLHNGAGLQIQPLDDLGRPATAWLNSSVAQQHVAVTALAGVSVPARHRTAAAR